MPGARVEPVFEQVFIGMTPALLAKVRAAEAAPAGAAASDPLFFERKLYVARKRIEADADALGLAERALFFIVSLSSRTLTYKGMLTAGQISPMFPDLSDPTLESALALVHQRFSTNTFPVVAAGAPVSLRRAQRRDQHAARQHQLDARARRTAPVGSASATT